MQGECGAPRFHQVYWEIRPVFVEKETAQFFGLVRRGWKNVALPVMPVRTFHRPLGFFLLIMITLGAKTINACAVFGFPSTLYPGFKVKVTHLRTQGGTDKTLVDVRQHLSCRSK